MTGGKPRLRLDTEPICAAYVNGASVKEIADMIGCNRHTVSHHLDRAGLRPIKSVERDPFTRLMSYVKKADNDCWIWTGYRAPNGYGRTRLHNRFIGAHVAMYILTKGTIPDGYEIDHQCHNRDLSCPGGESCQHRACVNPDHLEPATPAENRRRAVRRVTHCPQDHEYTPENTKLDRGTRKCLTCTRAKSAANQRARRAEELKRRMAGTSNEAESERERLTVAKVESIVKQLEAVGIPLDWGAQRARLAVQHLDVKASTDIWHEAIRIRRRATR